MAAMEILQALRGLGLNKSKSYHGCEAGKDADAGSMLPPKPPKIKKKEQKKSSKKSGRSNSVTSRSSVASRSRDSSPTPSTGSRISLSLASAFGLKRPPSPACSERSVKSANSALSRPVYPPHAHKSSGSGRNEFGFARFTDGIGMSPAQMARRSMRETRSPSIVSWRSSGRYNGRTSALGSDRWSPARFPVEEFDPTLFLDPNQGRKS